MVTTGIVIIVKHSNFSNKSGFIDFQGVFGSFYNSATIDYCIFQDSGGSIMHASVSNHRVTDYNSVYEYTATVVLEELYMLDAKNSNKCAN